ncbi:MAG: thioredoxin domain-containing protein, partial [Acidimicrobiales bacterium]
MNRLAGETSPYLRQHADNPVDWHPWGAEPFELAARRDVPVFVSIGYASCHWCHVMAHESFSDPAVADALAASFVSVKVDREERPDVDAVYMSATQALTGSGGWPMSVFCTPDGRPFYAGTYFPPSDRHGLPSFRRVLAAMADAWATRRGDVEAQAAALVAAVARQGGLTDRLDPRSSPPGAGGGAAALERLVGELSARFDPE